MALIINLRHLEKKDLRLEGLLTPGELEVEGFDQMVRLIEPVAYDLSIEQLSDSILVQGSLSSTLGCECVRCLARFEQPLELSQWVCDLPLAGEDKVAVDNDCVDLTP